MKKVAIIASTVGVAAGKTYLAEKFEDGWTSRWTVGSEWKPASETGEFKWTSGALVPDAADKGILTSEDARFYSISAPLDAEVNNAGKDLVLSYTVRYDETPDCGGAYIKLLNPGFNQKKFGGDTPYGIMFGPDVCGTSTRKTHVIFTKDGTNHLVKKNVRVETDKLSHRYTLIVRPDNSYEVQIDGKKAESGNIEEDFEGILPAKTIKDPSAKKPADWVDAAQVPDPSETKPAGYDDVPEKIVDPKAKKPEDWDDEDDGEWEAPLINNPDFKGEWKPKMIPNPDYKGPWVHPEVANPDYKEDKNLHAFCAPCSHVGFELWQVKAGSLFDDIYVGDSVEEAEAFSKATYEVKAPKEKALHDAAEKAKAEEAEAARKAAEAKEAASKDEDDEDDEDNEEL